MNNKEVWVEIFGMHYKKQFSDENHNKVLRMNGKLFVRSNYLEEL